MDGSAHLCQKEPASQCVYVTEGRSESRYQGLRYQIDNSEEYTPLHYAAEHGDKPMVDLLLKFKANYKLKNMFGRTAKDCSLNA